MKKLIALAVGTIFAVTMAFDSFAGAWVQNNGIWKWLNEDGTYATSCWAWLDGNKDGTAECYYFDNNGNMLANGATPDGYTVNANGAMVINGGVQTKDLPIKTLDWNTVRDPAKTVELSGLLLSQASPEKVESIFPGGEWQNGTSFYSAHSSSEFFAFPDQKHLNYVEKNTEYINAPWTTLFGIQFGDSWMKTMALLKSKNLISFSETGDLDTDDAIMPEYAPEYYYEADCEFMENGVCVGLTVKGRSSNSWGDPEIVVSNISAYR